MLRCALPVVRDDVRDHAGGYRGEDKIAVVVIAHPVITVRGLAQVIARIIIHDEATIAVMLGESLAALEVSMMRLVGVVAVVPIVIVVMPGSCHDRGGGQKNGGSENQFDGQQVRFPFVIGGRMLDLAA